MNPLDAVVLWVDGSDSKWLRERARAWKTFSQERQITCSRANAKSRFVSCQELLYCLRGLHNFVPWLRRIYLVTNGQRPAWLKEHPKIRLVTHREIMDPKDLPTFNSSAIEMNLHKIPGLSPAFLYLNDDFFLTRNIPKSRLFNPRGQAYYHTYTRLRVPTANYYNSFSWIIHSDEQCLNRLFGEAIRRRPWHQAFVVYRAAYQHLADRAPDLMRQTSAHRFRVDSRQKEHSLNIYAIEAIGLELGLYELKPVDRKDRELQQYHTSTSIREALPLIRSDPPIFLCINDLSTGEDRQMIEALMGRLIPKRAPWEAKETATPSRGAPPKSADSQTAPAVAC
jgi:hypothetical protein